MDASSSGPVWVFRVLHIATQAQKAFQTVVSGIRNDHVAISCFKVTGKNPHQANVDIGGYSLEGDFDSVKVLALTDFIVYGPLQLKAEMGKCTASTSFKFSFRGLPLALLGTF